LIWLEELVPIDDLSILKGIHPIIVLDKLLRERKLSMGLFAIPIYEYPHTLGNISKGKRSILP